MDDSCSVISEKCLWYGEIRLWK